MTSVQSVITISIAHLADFAERMVTLAGVIGGYAKPVLDEMLSLCLAR